MKDNMII